MGMNKDFSLEEICIDADLYQGNRRPAKEAERDVSPSNPKLEANFVGNGAGNKRGRGGGKGKRGGRGGNQGRGGYNGGYNQGAVGGHNGNQEAGSYGASGAQGGGGYNNSAPGAQVELVTITRAHLEGTKASLSNNSKTANRTKAAREDMTIST